MYEQTYYSIHSNASGLFNWENSKTIQLFIFKVKTGSKMKTKAVRKSVNNGKQRRADSEKKNIESTYNAICHKVYISATVFSK
jgi:hypothetical protein